MSFYKALEIFNKGLMQFAEGQRQRKLGEVYERAALAAEEVNSFEYEDPQERIDELRQLRNEFAAQATRLGASAQETAQMANNFSASESALFQASENEKLLARKFEQQKKLIRLRAEEQRATDAQKPPKKVPLPNSQIDKISEAMSSIREMELTLKQFEELEREGILPATGPSSSGLGLRQIVNNLADKDFAETFAQFTDQAEQRALQFQKVITGVSGSPEQLDQIRKSIPTLDKTPIAFRAGLTQSIELAKQRLRDHIKVLESNNVNINKVVLGVDSLFDGTEGDAELPEVPLNKKKLPPQYMNPQTQALIRAAQEIINNPGKYTPAEVKKAREVIRRIKEANE